MNPFPGPGDADFNVSGWIARLTADEQLAEQVAAALSSDPLIRGRRLEIIVQDGVVILQGELDSEEAREAARHRVWTLPGVRDFCDAFTRP
ncbi:BON domain-containing protein [Paractinoplanes maris]|uniref:BON domain-containing protein n=1 Tax=Paractinoplanes maris TaxID=1734446 RepID=UPI00201FE6F1|nr:BON domain-containing protein [Actinoplanes maris]